MSDLPRVVHRAPQILYGAALIFFVTSVVISHLQLGQMSQLNVTPAHQDRLVLVSAWLQAAQSAVYVAANGVIAQILLAIWRQRAGVARRGVDE